MGWRDFVFACAVVIVLALLGSLLSVLNFKLPAGVDLLLMVLLGIVVVAATIVFSNMQRID